VAPSRFHAVRWWCSTEHAWPSGRGSIPKIATRDHTWPSQPGDLTICRQHDAPSVTTDIERVLQTTYGSFMLSQFERGTQMTTGG
jgi:hypothetical protein